MIPYQRNQNCYPTIVWRDFIRVNLCCGSVLKDSRSGFGEESAGPPFPDLCIVSDGYHFPCHKVRQDGKYVCVYVCVRACVCVCQNEKRECQTNGKHYKRKSQAQWKEKYRTGRGPFRQSSHCHPDKRKRERLSTKSTHVTVYLFRDLNRDRSRLLWMTVGPKGQYSAKRRTRNRQSSKTFKRWSNLHRWQPLAVLRMSGVIVHLAPGASRRALGLCTIKLLAHAHSWYTHSGDEKKEKKKNQSSKKEGRKNNNKREEVRLNSPN